MIPVQILNELSDDSLIRLKTQYESQLALTERRLVALFHRKARNPEWTAFTNKSTWSSPQGMRG